MNLRRNVARTIHVMASMVWEKKIQDPARAVFMPSILSLKEYRDGWTVGHIVGMIVSWIVGRIVSWIVDWLVGWIIDWLVSWIVSWIV